MVLSSEQEAKPTIKILLTVAFRKKSDSIDCSSMISKVEDFVSSFSIPEVENSVSSSGGDNSSIRPKSGGVDPVGMTIKSLYELLGGSLEISSFYVEDLDGLVIGARNQESGVRTEGYTFNAGIVGANYGRREVVDAGVVPDSDSVVHRGCSYLRRGRTESYFGNG